ncbi:Zinc finger protein [Entamoeba marina]
MQRVVNDHRSPLHNVDVVPQPNEHDQRSGSFSSSSHAFSFIPYAEPYRPSRSGNASPVLSHRNHSNQITYVSSAPSTPLLSRSPRKSSLSLKCDNINNQNGCSSPGSNVNTSLYKTELCKSYSETGTCRYGSKCQFAHGEEELRQVQRHPRYKTEICQSFQKYGTCKYGSRCKFIHVSQEDISPVDTLGSPMSQNCSDISLEEEEEEGDHERLPIFQAL